MIYFFRVARERNRNIDRIEDRNVLIKLKLVGQIRNYLTEMFPLKSIDRILLKFSPRYVLNLSTISR